MIVGRERAGLETPESATRWALVLAAVLGIATLGIATAAAADPCVVADDGSGTVTLPPAGCEYLSPDEVHLIIDGLPPGTTIELAPIHKDFICGDPVGTCTTLIPPGECESAGGSLGGNGDCFSSSLQLQLTGTGLLAGFNRLITVPAQTEIHTGPRNPGDPVQDFPADVYTIQGDIFGDPDFNTLSVRAGTGFGLPSPGQTTLTDLGDGTFNVDSFFDISYEIEFQGAPGSILDGMAGTTQATLRMQAGEAVQLGNPCEVPDNGTGTITLPPEGCEYLSPDEVHMILNDLPPGTTIELAAIHKDFICRGSPQTQCSVSIPPGLCEIPGGGLGGNIDCFDSVAELAITGTGALSGFQRTIFLPLNTEVHTGPRNPGDPVQSFPSDMARLEGAIFGDPDFDILQITAGTDHGLPSPGHTTLTQQPGGTFAVDSFFDITYRIDFQGAPGGQLDGLSGSTTGTIRMQTGEPAAPVDVPALPLPLLLAIGGVLAASGGLVVKLLRRRLTGG